MSMQHEMRASGYNSILNS